MCAGNETGDELLHHGPLDFVVPARREQKFASFRQLHRHAMSRRIAAAPAQLPRSLLPKTRRGFFPSSAAEGPDRTECRGTHCIVRIRAVGGQILFEGVEIGNSTVHELMQNLAAKRLPGVWRIVGAVVIAQKVHDALGHSASRASCLRPRRVRAQPAQGKREPSAGEREGLAPRMEKPRHAIVLRRRHAELLENFLRLFNACQESSAPLSVARRLP